MSDSIYEEIIQDNPIIILKYGKSGREFGLRVSEFVELLQKLEQKQ